jgi:outer membrane protein assembly factor BamB
VWKAELGVMNTKHAHGEGASPVLHGDTVVVNWDHEGESAIHAFDKHTGKLKWRKERDEVTSWSSPIVIEHEGKFQVIVSATKRIRAYDLEDGTVIWECGGMSNNVVASPVYAEGVVIAACSYDKRAIMAIKVAGAKGDITGTDQVLWQTNQRTPYVPSPLLVDSAVLFLNHYQGVLSCLDYKTGETLAGPFRLGPIRDVYASPVSAAQRIYITDRSGTTLVLSAGAEPDEIAINKLDDVFSASAALVGKELFLRGEKHLYCIAE